MNPSGEGSLVINVIDEKESYKIMEQGKTNLSSTTQDTSTPEIFKVAQQLYEEYFASNDDSSFAQLITASDSIYGRQVRRLLK